MSDTTTTPVEEPLAMTPAPDLDFDFGYLHDVDTATAEWRLPTRDGETYIVVRPAHQANRQFVDAFLAVRTDRDLDDEGDVTLDQLSVYPGNVIVGWRGMRNKHGVEVPFSLKACRAVWSELPEWVQRSCHAFCLTISNFFGVEPESPEVTAGN